MIAERPRITWIRRRQPGEISIGDSAEARLAPGLIGLLEAIAPKSGFHAPYNIPASLAGTAAVAVVSSPTTNWTGRDLEVEWQGTPGPHDAVFAEARLEQYSERLAAFAIRGRTQANQPLFHGTLRLTGIRDGMPAGFRSREEYEQLRQQFPKTNPEQIGLGHTVWIEIPAGANVELPFGRGLSIEAIESSRILVRADRPHEVNLGRPWELKVGATTIPIRVPDPNPGRTFYILTEDCETFDGGPLTGNYAGSEHLGNHNNFMDPEDYRVQMIAKPNRLNEIAERYGARWTHFYCATQRFGAEWAAKQSLTGEWPKVIAEMDASVREGSRHHEYSPHIHFDYEPDSKLPPQPRLVYDPATDGILPNDYYHPETNPRHHYHDWDGSARGIAYIKKLGDLNELDSKAGSMRKSMRHLARLQVNRRAPLVARTGSYDFGKSPEDQTISTQAFEANGLRGNSDAYRPGGAPTAGGQMFWCAAHDRYAHIKDLHDARLVQFGITMDSGFDSAAEMNRWFQIERQSCSGPGVHGILFTTHAMFFAGKPDPFRSLEGGTFEQFERHLQWIRANHPDVEFATASEALLEFLDYYSPTLQAYVEPILTGGYPRGGRYEFPVRLLGKGIRVDERHPATVEAVPPACFDREDIQEFRLIQDGREVTVLTSRAPLRLEVVVHPGAIAKTLEYFGDVVYYEAPEPSGNDLLRLHTVADVVKLLMNPVAGNAEPLGRRVHPLGGLAIGAALSAVPGKPQRMKLRWLKEASLDADYFAEVRAGRVEVRDDSGALVAIAEVSTA